MGKRREGNGVKNVLVAILNKIEGGDRSGIVLNDPDDRNIIRVKLN